MANKPPSISAKFHVVFMLMTFMLGSFAIGGANVSHAETGNESSNESRVAPLSSSIQSDSINTNTNHIAPSTSETNSAQNSTVRHSNAQEGGEQADSKLAQQPDSLIGYIKQEIQSDETDKAEPLNPTDNLQLNTELTGDYNDAYYEVNELNGGLPEIKPPPNLQTPLATLEFFNTAIIEKRFGLAGYALNLNGIAKAEQTTKSSELAKKLDYLLTEKNLYIFEDLPDRADGLIEPPIGSSNPIMGVTRRSIKLGYIDYKNRRVPISLQRVHVKDSPPIWVFSSQTVANIDILYDIHKPAQFERYLPDWLTKKFMGMSVWEGLALLFAMLVALGLGYVVSKGVAKFTTKYASHMKEKKDADEMALHNKGLTDLFSKITVPLTMTISFGLLFALVSGGLPKIQAIATSTRPFMWMALVFSGLWLGIRSINFFANRFQDLHIDALDEEEFNKQRERMTYLSIFRRIFIFVMIIGGLWVSLAEFADLEGLGKTLLTSAGIAGAVIGIAAQPTLGNIIAGFQVAVTQPIRIGDTVMLDGTWTEVEDLRYTYAVLKTWDDRRLIVPMKHFVTEVLENWSHTNVEQSSAIYLYVDYGADISAIRQKYEDVATGHKLWNEDAECEMLVTSVDEDTIKLRCKVTSDSPQNAWTLECEVREQMLQYLAGNHAKHLPTERITLSPREV